MKKLNRKGFTLIELLAVVVILAIIMIIAIPNVLDSVNNSRVSTLHSKAKSIVENYATEYAAELLPTSGTKTVTNFNISNNWTCIGAVNGFAEWAGLNEADYNLSTIGVPTSSTLTVDSTTCSAVKQLSSGKIEVLLIANISGKFHVAGHTLTYAYSEDPEGSFVD